jgi:transposase
MMGRQRRDQGRLFYEFRLDDRVPQNHLLRRIDVFVTAALADLHHELEPYYSEIGRPSVDAYRWFCKLDLEDEIPHHSTFSANRVGAINFIRHCHSNTLAWYGRAV